MTEQYQCKSYSDDDRNVQDCTCGKCGNTPDAEWEKEFEAKFPRHGFDNNPENEFHSQLIKSFITQLLTSRDNYWKERVDRVLIAMSWREENETSEAIRVLAEIRERLVVTNEDNLK